MIKKRDAGLALVVTTQYVTTAQALPAGAFTLMGWFQVRDASATDRPMLGSGTSGAPAVRWESSDRSVTFYKIGTGDIVASSAQALQPYTWAHVAITHDGATACLYLNGALVASAADATSFTAATVRVGNDGTNNFSGRLDECAGWSVALTAEQIADIHAQGPAAYPRSSRLFDYRFDDVSVTTIADESGNSNTGTPSATPSWTTATFVQPAFKQRDFGLCMRFNGSNEGIVLPGALTQRLDGAGAITLLAWARPLNPITSSRRVVGLQSDTSNSAALIQSTPSGGNLYWETFGRSQGSDSTETTTVTTVNAPEHGRWAHVALILDYANDTFAFSHNGLIVVKDTSIAWSRASFLGSNNGGYIGSGVGANYWSGDIDEVMVYRRALSAAELRHGYLTGQWDATDRLLLVDFDDGEIEDRSPYAHTLTASNVDASNLFVGLM